MNLLDFNDQILTFIRPCRPSTSGRKGLISFYVLNFYTNLNMHQVKHSSYCKTITLIYLTTPNILYVLTTFKSIFLLSKVYFIITSHSINFYLFNFDVYLLLQNNKITQILVLKCIYLCPKFW